MVRPWAAELMVGGLSSEFLLLASSRLSTAFAARPTCTDGKDPYAGVIQATDGNLYGTTYDGGVNGFGTIFELDSKGKFTTLYSFCPQYACPDGGYPMAGLLEDTGGYLDGTTSTGGLYYFGTTYSLSV